MRYELDLDSEFEASLDRLLAPDLPEGEIRRRRVGRGPRAANRLGRRGRPPRLSRPSRPRRPSPRPWQPRPQWPDPRPWRPPYRRLFLRRRPTPTCICPAHGTEFVRWVQISLNRLQGSRLPLTGVMSRIARDELRRFQARQGLIVDGIAGPETEHAIMAARADRRVNW